jgi:cytochrome c-type biogenesis protein CcmH/NrfF
MSFEWLVWFAGGIVIGIMIMLIIIIHLRNKAMKEVEEAMKKMDVKTIEQLLKGEGEKNER